MPKQSSLIEHLKPTEYFAPHTVAAELERVALFQSLESLVQSHTQVIDSLETLEEKSRALYLGEIRTSEGPRPNRSGSWLRFVHVKPHKKTAGEDVGWLLPVALYTGIEHSSRHERKLRAVLDKEVVIGPSGLLYAIDGIGRGSSISIDNLSEAVTIGGSTIEGKRFTLIDGLESPESILEINRQPIGLKKGKLPVSLSMEYLKIGSDFDSTVWSSAARMLSKTAEVGYLVDLVHRSESV